MTNPSLEPKDKTLLCCNKCLCGMIPVEDRICHNENCSCHEPKDKGDWEERFYDFLKSTDDYYSQPLRFATPEEPNPPRLHYLRVSGSGIRLDNIVKFISTTLKAERESLIDGLVKKIGLVKDDEYLGSYTPLTMEEVQKILRDEK